MDYEPSVLGRTVRVLRAEQRVKQKDLAAYARIAPVTLSRLEAGEIQDLQGATVARIADRLGVSMDVFYAQPNTLMDGMRG